MKEAKLSSTNIIILVLGIALIGVLIYGGYAGWFSSNITINSTVPVNITNAPNASSTYFVSLRLIPNVTCVGEEVLGIIISNMPNGMCAIFSNSGKGFVFYKNVLLNSTGGYHEYTKVNTAGKVTFKAMCLKDNQYQISNESVLKVNDCGTPEEENETPVIDCNKLCVDEGYESGEDYEYDAANPTLCDDPEHEQVHFGNDTCCCKLKPEEPEQLPYNCTDSDNGINWTVWGFCEDSYHSAGFGDMCNGMIAIEYYCNSSGICDSVTQTCPAGTTCVGGVCQHPPCGAIIFPFGQISCDPGYCDGGTCTFFPATMPMPARCLCI